MLACRVTPGRADPLTWARGDGKSLWSSQEARRTPRRGRHQGKQASPQPAQQAAVNSVDTGRRPSGATDDQDPPPTARRRRSGGAAAQLADRRSFMGSSDRFPRRHIPP